MPASAPSSPKPAVLITNRTRPVTRAYGRHSMENAQRTIPAEFRDVVSIVTATEVVIGGRTVIGIEDARDLHAGLKVGRDFTNWIKGRIKKYGFREGVDFEHVRQNGRTSTGGVQVSLYRLTLTMAKELAMVENSEIGRLVRRYFIWVEALIQEDGKLSRADAIALFGDLMRQRAAEPEPDQVRDHAGNLRIVVEARQSFGCKASQQMWFKLGLPTVPAMFDRPGQSDLFDGIEGNGAANEGYLS